MPFYMQYVLQLFPTVQFTLEIAEETAVVIKQ